MTDYVLIHGAWHGSWCWARVRRLLAAGAHRVFTPTLTGVGERSHLLSRDVGLKSDTFWLVVLKVLSASFTPRQESAAGGRRSLHAGMM